MRLLDIQFPYLVWHPQANKQHYPREEDKYQKVALYVKKDSKTWTHAARELRNGFWTSKLGQGYDIQHGTPFTIEGDSYGEVYCIMKRIFQ